jgi:hypothetical protein
MNYKPLARRLARLEQDAYARHAAWLATLSDAELDALVAATPAYVRAAYAAMTDDDLERLASGRMSNAEQERRLQDARQHDAT